MSRLRSILVVAFAACGGSTHHTPPDAQADAQPDSAIACTPGAACTTNPGGPCKTGVVACQNDQKTCVDATDVTDGTVCASGVCTRGSCLAPVTASSTIDVSTSPLTPGRTCAESPAYGVTALTSTTATLATAPDAGCLAPGDEVLLIDLQGTPGAVVNVGNWELLEVATASASVVTFASAKTRSYGDTAGSDSGSQKVALVRVAQFGALSIDNGATITTAPWNGQVGGVLALRAASLTIDGTITAAGLGYRGGRWSQDDASCTDNIATEPGESIAGPSAGGTTASFGGAGGIAAASGISFIAQAPINSGSSHATAGTMGADTNGRTVGAPGAVYGHADASTLTLGSGNSGNVTCDANNTTGPILITTSEQLAGGIVLLLAQNLTVHATGAITASAKPSARDVTAAGGYIFLRGSSLALGTARVTAVGGTTTGQGNNSATTVQGGDGYIVVQGQVTGTTTPAAHQL